MIKAVIFDMDGTLVDTTNLDYMAWEKVFGEYNINFSYEEYIRILGVKSSEVIKSRMDLEQDELERVLKKKMTYVEQLVNEKGLQLIPHVEIFLQKIKDKPLKTALATGSRNDKLELVLKTVKLEKYFDVFITGDEVKKGKPDPEIFLKATEKLGVKPSECIVIEDAENGVFAAKKANIFCIAITTTTSKENLRKADLIIDSFEDLDIIEVIIKMRSKT